MPMVDSIRGILSFYALYYRIHFVLCAIDSSNSTHLVLKAPPVHVSLTGDIPITIERPPGQFLESARTTFLVSHADDDQSTPLCSIVQHIPAGVESFSFHLPCGCFILPGLYTIGAYSSNDTFSNYHSSLEPQDRTEIRVIKPPINLHLPERANRQAAAVTFSLSSGRTICHPNSSLISFLDDWFNHVYISIQRAIHTGEEEGREHGWRRVETIEGRDWWTLASTNSSVPLPCGLFTRPGLYKVALIGHSEIVIVDSASVVVEEETGEEYGLAVVGHHVYPCPPETGLAVSYRQPATPTCTDSVAYESIRLYAVQQETVHSGLSPNMTRTYVTEEKVPVGRGQTGVAYFGCNHFDLIYPQHCFQFVTVHTDGTVLERTRQCLQTQSTKYPPVHGEWSSWQPWGQCTASCGSPAVQHRLRYCNKPSPTNGGQFCIGNGLETRKCTGRPCPAPPVTTPHPSPSPPPIHECLCGCNSSQPRGTLIIRANPHCPTNPSIWRISTDTPSHHISIRIISIEFSNPDAEWLRIHGSGHSEQSEILLLDTSQNDEDALMENRQILINTESNSATIEYTRNDDKNETKYENPDGYLSGVWLKYETYQRNGRDWSWWTQIRLDQPLSIVFICLIVVTALLCSALSYFVAYRYTIGHLRSKLAWTSRNTPDLSTMAVLGEMAESTPIKRRYRSKTDESPLLTVRKSVEIVNLRKGRRSTRAREPPEGDETGAVGMHASTHTETTRISGMTQSTMSGTSGQAAVHTVKSPPRTVRSIGIQLNSPTLDTLRRRASMDRAQSRTTGGHRRAPSSVAIDATTHPGSPNLSLAGTDQDDFEYDYYDAPVLGSVFNCQRQTELFQTDIDIDDIIEQSDLMRPANTDGSQTEPMTRPATASVSIQNGGADSAESSEWSYKWTKPSGPLTQFHFL